MKSLLCTFMVVLFFALGTASAQSPAPTPAPAVPVLDSVTVQEFVGKYDTGGMGNLIVSFEQGKVIGTLEGQGSAPLAPTPTPDVFNIEGYEGKATFIRDEAKKVVKVKLEVQGQVIEATRL